MWFLILVLLVVIIVFSFSAGLAIEASPYGSNALIVGTIVASLFLLRLADPRIAAQALNGESGLLKSEIYEVVGDPAAQGDGFLVFLKDSAGNTLAYRLPAKPPTIFKVIAGEGGGLMYVLYPTISDPLTE